MNAQRATVVFTIAYVARSWVDAAGAVGGTSPTMWALMAFLTAVATLSFWFALRGSTIRWFLAAGAGIMPVIAVSLLHRVVAMSPWVLFAALLVASLVLPALLARVFADRAPVLEGTPAVPDHAVIVHLDGRTLPDEVYATCDVDTLEEQLMAVLDQHALGDLDGHALGETGTTLFVYGPDAEKLFALIEPTLLASPLARGARVVLRAGDPGAPEREVVLPR